MAKCYVLESQGEDSVTVFRSLKRLMVSIGKARLYQTYRRKLQNVDKYTTGNVTIRNGTFIPSTHDN